MCTVFIDVGLSRAFTVLWPHHQVPSGSLLMRSELTPMPNYAHVDYWKRHYDVSSSSQHHDWFVPWKAVRGVVMNALPNRGRGSVALNLGCGNSRSSREIIGDEAASFILNVDVARSSMDGILRIALEDEAKASRAASQQSALKGIEQFVTLDAVQMPFRSGGIVDWIFDKGTLDGILYNPEGVQMLRQIWARLGQILVPGGLLVLVSLGRPEGRLDLIENQIGGWMVDDCFEVTTAKGAESATFQFGSGIDSCFVYICRKV
ncbi:uncharacterized protein BJ171DRAFT_485687 [Polychytrium aggregatum]|uniref:uncharacterized protein n=1 Tax=Polychytrium aggregatum TaxID=110093 RepID=UPI0022FE52AB|nr:uncharacterized protein BJ171DRAFT_485687 [Polychytrium aggregatum]KAI9209184.1 hypothetical protein BJ171DRAFT_485687 [Polychytrium aggregatum]